MGVVEVRGKEDKGLLSAGVGMRGGWRGDRVAEGARR